jgi:hypothetical protein
MGSNTSLAQKRTKHEKATSGLGTRNLPSRVPPWSFSATLTVFVAILLPRIATLAHTATLSNHGTRKANMQSSSVGTANVELQQEREGSWPAYRKLSDEDRHSFERGAMICVTKRSHKGAQDSLQSRIGRSVTDDIVAVHGTRRVEVRECVTQHGRWNGWSTDDRQGSDGADRFSASIQTPVEQHAQI